MYHRHCNSAVLTGRTEEHLCDESLVALLGRRVHRDVVEPFLVLREEAKREGFELALESAFRSFEVQLFIWNRKAKGELSVLDRHGEPVAIGDLTPLGLVRAILRWSALPGASRHHWGTELDVYDARACPPGYRVELVPQEVEGGGIFAPLHRWLDERIRAGRSFGFFRPYDQDRGGVSPERWHLSHAPTAEKYRSCYTLEVLREALEGADLLLKGVVLEHLEELYHRFVVNVGTPPWQGGEKVDGE